ncbi:hypothetical protein ASE38_17715 [Cellulomonas sp. Root930]|nr:hypothetical protein ASE38_17715 [Cellulomonas sp. Root930]
MTDYADLEISVHRRDAITYAVELRFQLPGSDVENRLDADGPLLASIDPAALDQLDDDEYGAQLGRGLFGGGVGNAFRTAVATSQSKGVRLRVRLVIGRTANALHGVRWETLRDPSDGSTLLTNENVLFSRYLGSLDWRPVSVRPRGDLSALALIAAPSNLDAISAGRPLAPVDTEAERTRARQALDGMDLTELPGTARPTAAHLIERLRRGVDVLYLVCHGYLANDEPVLLLEDDEGRAAPMLGSDLVARLREITRPPRLVFLASCQSAGAGADRSSADAGVLSALGPRLASSGVPAVIAMQGNVSMTTAATFTTSFFSSLDEDGLVDRATAVARSVVRERPDWWVPALFMRLKSGRLWYVPGTAPGGARFDKWPSVVADIKADKCTPIIGPGISDPLIGSRQEIARTWARSYRFPMAPHNRESLPQVAQYLSINLGRRFPRLELENHLRRTLVDRYHDELPEELLGERASLDDVLEAAWEAVAARGGTEPYSVLAEIPTPIYITAQPSFLLAKALIKAGREPEIELCRWREDQSWPESVFEREPGYRPTAQRPLVYHLLGALSEPQSLVLTEDDYFDFLIGVTLNQDLVPAPVKRALTDSALMFVGFRIDEWDFRVLYRSLMNSEGGRRRDDYTHVAVQIDPEEGTTIDAERARRYLESYFDHSHISLYWGSTESFIKELADEWRQRR